MKRMMIMLVCLLGICSGTAWAEIVIIANASVVETTISPKKIEDIFLGKVVQWPDNSAIHVVTVKDSKIHQAFLDQYLKKSEAQWNVYWKRMVFTGTGTPPEQAETQQALLEYVAKTKGAIGYLEAPTPVENVKIMEIE